ncbi:MAG: DUF4157 domain-containing protein [Bacteroidia bacterium]|nr:DUF4157 domain-containing protein [Bacteroidia bacterium]
MSRSIQEKEQNHSTQEMGGSHQGPRGMSMRPPKFALTTDPVQKKEKEEQSGEMEGPSMDPTAQRMANPNGLPGTVQAKMENSFGADFSNVNVHQNSQSATDMGALAYTQGNDVHFAPGQFKPDTRSGQELIGHELTHVVQQRQGRVTPTTQAKGLAVNDDRGLEAEADQMGAKAARGEVVQNKSANGSAKAGVTQRKVVQMATDQVAHYGTYKPVNYGINSAGNKLQASIAFEPNDQVSATKIGFTQSIYKNIEGANVVIDPAARNRMVTEGDEAGNRIDRISSRNTPIYGSSDLGQTAGVQDGLSATPETNNTSGNPTQLDPDAAGGYNATYDLGHRYLDNAGTEQKKNAGMYDGPTIDTSKEQTVEFESTALAIEGNQAGTYYGSVKWGFKVDSTGTASEVEFKKLSDGTPTSNFMAAAGAWNNATVRGTYAANEANVPVKQLNNSSITLGNMAEGDECTQIDPYIVGGVYYVHVNITTGALAGQDGLVEVAKLTDTGNGPETVDLPIDEVYTVTTPSTLRTATGNIDLESGSRVILKNWNQFMGNYVEVEVGDGEHTGKRGSIYQGNLSGELNGGMPPLGPGVPDGPYDGGGSMLA